MIMSNRRRRVLQLVLYRRSIYSGRTASYGAASWESQMPYLTSGLASNLLSLVKISTGDTSTES